MQMMRSFAICGVVAALFLASSHASTWTQSGNAIDGTTADERFGHELSISDDGLRVAVSSDRHNSTRGRVVVYEKSGNTWTQLGGTFYGAAVDDLLGFDVALSPDGKRLAIGSYKNDDGATDGGKVSVYEYASGAWSQLGADINGAEDYDYLGYSVSFSSDGSILAVGAPYAKDADGNQAGVVRVYQYASSAWTQLGSDITGSATDEYCGNSVGLSADGTRVVVGIPYASPRGQYSGIIRVYDYSSSAWSKVGGDINGATANDYAGYKVAISADGSHIAASIPLASGVGRARVYALESGLWAQVGSDFNGVTMDAYMGYGLALNRDGSRFAVSEPWNSEPGTYRGRVFVYDLDSAGAWQANTHFNGTADNDNQGTALAMTPDGGSLAMSAIYYDGAAANIGRSLVYSTTDVLVEPTTAAPTPAPEVTTTAAPAGDTQTTPSAATMMADRSSWLLHFVVLAYMLVLLTN